MSTSRETKYFNWPKPAPGDDWDGTDFARFAENVDFQMNTTDTISAKAQGDAGEALAKINVMVPQVAEAVAESNAAAAIATGLADEVITALNTANAANSNANSAKAVADTSITSANGAVSQANVALGRANEALGRMEWAGSKWANLNAPNLKINGSAVASDVETIYSAATSHANLRFKISVAQTQIDRGVTRSGIKAAFIGREQKEVAGMVYGLNTSTASYVPLPSVRIVCSASQAGGLFVYLDWPSDIPRIYATVFVCGEIDVFWQGGIALFEPDNL